MSPTILESLTGPQSPVEEELPFPMISKILVLASFIERKPGHMLISKCVKHQDANVL